MAALREVTVDREADAGYLALSGAPVARTADHGSFVVDYSTDGSPVGIEVLTLDRPLDVHGVLEVLGGTAVDPDTDAWVRAFAARIVDDRVPSPPPAGRPGPRPPANGTRFPAT